MASFDLAVIGAGPGGYVAAIRAAQLGAKVALVERADVGGVCLNRGCIPTKAMIASAHALENVRSAGRFGVVAAEGAASIDMRKVVARKDEIVSSLRGGIASLLKGRAIEFIKGSAAFTGPGEIAVDGNALSAKRILIATGSTWIDLPGLSTDGETIVTSDEALDWKALPKSVAIVGGGVVGCEFACMLRAMGSDVTIIEATPSILPPVEKAITRLLTREMKGGGIKILTATTVESARTQGGSASFKLSSGEELEAEKIMVAVGRRPLTEGLGLEAAGIELAKRGFIKVDAGFRTSGQNVYAIGDVIGFPMLAHAASREGILAVEGMFSSNEQRTASRGYDPALCPSPIFTSPEIGSVGKTSEELSATGVAFKSGRFPYAASGKALCDGEPGGQAIVHTDESGKILGVHMIGREATTIIAEAALAMQHGMTATEVAETVHAHPTLSEIFAEACEDAAGMAIHKMKAGR